MGGRPAERVGPALLSGSVLPFYVPLSHFFMRLFSNDFFGMSDLFLCFGFSFFRFFLHTCFCDFLFTPLLAQVRVVSGDLFPSEALRILAFGPGFFSRRCWGCLLRRDGPGCGAWRGHPVSRDFRRVSFGRCARGGGFGGQSLKLIEIESDFAAVDRFVLDPAFVQKPEKEGDNAQMQQHGKEKGERQPTNALLLRLSAASGFPVGRSAFL